MDSDVCPADQLPSASSDSLCFATAPVNEASGVEVTTQTRAALPQVEDLESYNMIEPPPLDWRSDSSSEVGSADNLDDPSFPPSEHLDEASPGEPVLLPLNKSDASFNNMQQEVVSSIVKPVLDIRMKSKEEDQAADEEPGVDDLEGSGAYQEEVTLHDQKSSVSEEETEGANKKSGDEDHNSIHSLLSQLQLMEEEPHPTQLTPPHPVQHRYSGLSELETCTSSLLTDNSTETTGLLFSESHHRDLLGLLQFTEIGVNPHPSPLPHSEEVDAVVSVSYSQEDAQRFWEHYGNGQQQHRESLSSLPDDEYPEPVWKKRGSEPPKEDEAATETEQVGRGAVVISKKGG